MITSRRLALVSIVFLFGAAACGDPSSSVSTSPGVSATSPSDQPEVIRLASGSGGVSGAPAPAAAESASDSKMALMGPTEFVYDGDLPALDGPSASWYFAPGQVADPARIAQLAESLGVTGDLRAMPEDQGGGWAIGPEDYSGPVLTVGSDGLLSWWLSGAVPTSARCAVAGVEPASGEGVAGSSGTAVVDPPVDPTTTELLPPDAVVPECATPEPPVNVPTKDEALAKAKELFASWGYDVNSYEFDEPYADEWSASVNAWLIVDGMRAPITLSVGFGENGTVSWASGSLATPQRGADYPTIGAAAGLELLKEQQNQYRALDATAVTEGVPEVVSPEATAGTADIPAGTSVITPDIAIAPCEPGVATDCAPLPNAEPVTVTLNSVKPDLTMLWAADDTIWLLPAYTFESADGGMYTVLAVDDAYIQQAEPELGVAEEGNVPSTVYTTVVSAPASGQISGTSPLSTQAP